MRISDWSSDVCSSDLHRGQRARPDIPFDAQRRAADLVARIQSGIEVGETIIGIIARKGIALRRGERRELTVQRPLRRSEERRVGKESVSTCRYRWWR